MNTTKLFFLSLPSFLEGLLKHLMILLKRFLKNQTFTSINHNFSYFNKAERWWSTNLLVIIMLLISQFVFSQNALKATGGTGAFKNDIYWLNFSGVSNLGPGGATSLSRNFTINGVDVTVTINNISFSGKAVVVGSDLSSVRLAGYRPGNWQGDGLDNVYNIGGAGTNNTLVNALSTSVNGAGNGNELIANFTISAYATVSGQPLDIGLVFASAEDDANNEYTQCSTNGTEWNMIESIIQASSTNGNRAITFSSSNTVATMRMGSATGFNTYGNNPSNVALLYTLKQASSSSNLLTSVVQTKGGGRSSIALGILLRQDFGDLPTTYGTAGNIYSPVTTGGTNNPVNGTVYLSTGTGGGSPVITAATISDSQTLRLGNLGGDANEGAYPAAGNGTNDNATGVADEDAFTTLPSLTTTQPTYTLNIPAFKNTTTGAAPAYIMAWIDFNRNGTFEPAEYITTSFTTNNALTNVPLVWNLATIPKVAGTTFARFRITSTDPATLTDNSSTTVDERSAIVLANGETEDYPNLIVIGPPVANNDVLSGQLPGAVTFPNILSNDVKDPNGAALSPDGVSLITPSGATGVTTDAQGDVTGFTVPGQGTWAYNSTTGGLTFTPQSGYTGNPTPVNYTVRSPEGIVSNQATVTITYINPCTISESNPDSDGDGISNACDLDDDNDGILDTNECNGNEVFLNPDLLTTSSTNITNWNLNIGTVSGSLFISDEELAIPQVVSQNITNVNPYGLGAILNMPDVRMGDGSPTAASDFVSFSVRYNGVTYLNITSSEGPSNPTLPIQYLNGASGNLSNLNFGLSTINSLSINLPSSIPNSGLFELVFDVTNKDGITSDGTDDVAINSVSIITCGDTDNDGIANSLDLDSDNDGCLDAIEGGADITTSQLVNSAGTVSVGSGSTASNQNLCAANTCVNSNGIPQLSPIPTGYNNNTGQSIGSSQNSLVNTCFCYETPTNLTASVPVKHGITVLGRAGSDNGNWPMLRNSAYTALEGKTKGFVITRNSSPETTITNPVVGMMVFDTNEGATGCLKIYTGSGAGEGWKCFSSQGCP